MCFLWIWELTQVLIVENIGLFAYLYTGVWSFSLRASCGQHYTWHSVGWGILTGLLHKKVKSDSGRFTSKQASWVWAEWLKHRKPVQAAVCRSSRSFLSARTGFDGKHYKIWAWNQWVMLSNWKTTLLNKDVPYSSFLHEIETNQQFGFYYFFQCSVLMSHTGYFSF